MKVLLFSKDIKNLDEGLYVTVSKLFDTTSRNNYKILRFILFDGFVDTYYFDNQNLDLYETYLVIIRLIKRNSRNILRVFAISRLDYIEELFWRKILLDFYEKSMKKITSSKKIEKKEKLQPREDTNKKEIKVEQTTKDKNIEKDITQDIELEINCNENDITCLRKAIIKIIESLDRGEGVELTKISEYLGISESKLELIISQMLMAGELYEYSPGKLKILK